MSGGSAAASKRSSTTASASHAIAKSRRRFSSRKRSNTSVAITAVGGTATRTSGNACATSNSCRSRLTKARPRALPPSDPAPIRENTLRVSKLPRSKSATVARLRPSRYSSMDSIRSARRSSSVAKSDTLRGRMRCATANSVRAFSHLEKSLREAWCARLSPGTSRISASSVFRSAARPTSAPSGVRNTKSPKPKCSTMNRRSSCRSSGDPLRRKEAPTEAATASLAGTVDCSITGTSGCASRTRRANSTPASAATAPFTGNSTSEITPSTFSR